MELASLEQILKSDVEISRDPFNVARQLCEMYNNADNQTVSKVQDLVIRALDKYDLFGDSRTILDSLLRELGLFPYLDFDSLSIPDALAYIAHSADIGNSDDVIFHGPQAEVYYKLASGQSVVLSAPTSFGKSLIIDAIIASKLFNNIVIVVPTISLIDETRRRLAKFKQLYKVITHSLQSRSDRNIYVLTQERVLEDDFIGSVDFFVIDEFYKLSPWADDGNRCALLNEAFYRLYKKCQHFYMLGPNIQGVAGAFIDNVKFEFIKYNYNTVVTEFHDYTHGTKDSKLIDICSKVSGQTIIFCSSPDRANAVATCLQDSISASEDKYSTGLSDWLSVHYHKEWILTKSIRCGVGIHHARIPRGVSQYIVELFNSGKLKFLVCTSTLIEGVNTTAKNIICYDDRINKKKLDIFTFNNIAGRSGRMLKHFIGNVYLLSPPPEDSLPFVDVPLYTQDKTTPDSLLINLDDEDLSDASRERIKPYVDQKDLSIETIRKNKTVEPKQQIIFAKQLASNLDRWSSMLLWRGFPEYEQLVFVCELIWGYFDGAKLGNRSVSSYKQLAFRLNQLMSKPSIGYLVQARLDYKPTDNVTDIISNILDFKRLWASFHFPRLLRTIELIVNELLKHRKYNYTCDYTAYATAVENLFYDPSIIALEEYGLPIEVAELFERKISTAGNLDQALSVLAKLDSNICKNATDRAFLIRAQKGI